MNKKLIILIVALECVFSVFLISIFGPMIEAHHKIGVQEIQILDAAGHELESGSTVELESDARSYTLSWQVIPENATEADVTITVFSGTEELDEENDIVKITPENGGTGARITFRKRKPVRIILYATDGSGVSASVMLTFAVSDDPSNVDPFQ